MAVVHIFSGPFKGGWYRLGKDPVAAIDIVDLGESITPTGCLLAGKNRIYL